MDKLKPTGQDLSRVFNSRLGCACICRAIAHITKRPNLKVRTWPKQLLGSLLLAFVLPGKVPPWEPLCPVEEFEEITGDPGFASRPGQNFDKDWSRYLGCMCAKLNPRICGKKGKR